MTASAAAKRPGAEASRRRAARLAAVQAVYQIDLTGAEAASVLTEFRHHRLGRDADRSLFEDLVQGTWARRQEIDQALSGTLVESWPLQRLDRTLRSIMRVGVYELSVHEAVPVAVVINEYVDLAHAFFGGKEPGMVNAVLDRLAQDLRPDRSSDAAR